MKNVDNTIPQPWDGVERRDTTQEEQEANIKNMSIERAKTLLRAVIEGKTRRTPEYLQLRDKELISDVKTTQLILRAKNKLYTTYIVSKMMKQGWSEETDDFHILSQEESDEIEQLLEAFDPNGFIRRMQESFAEKEEENELRAKAEIKAAKNLIKKLIIMILCGATGFGIMQALDNSIIKKHKADAKDQKALIEKLQHQLSQAQEAQSGPANTGEEIFTDELPVTKQYN